MNWLLQNPVYFWLVMAGIFLIVEGVTYALVTLWFVGGSLAAMLLAFFNVNFILQILVFIIVSIILLVLTRPLLKKRPEALVKTNVDAVLGKRGIVTMEAGEHYSGQGKVDGQIWTIMSQDGETLEVDSEFIVLTVQGVKLLVKSADESSQL